MKEENLKIQVFEDINDTELKTAWQKLQHECQAFPQMYYEWIEPWVRLRFKDRKLRIITVKDGNEIVAIAPYCIEKKFGIKILNSIPIHYGDKYEFIISSNYDSEKIVHFILNDLKTQRGFSIIKTNQVEHESSLYKSLKSYGLIDKVLVSCPISDFTEMSFENFFMKLKRNVRSDFRRGKKRIQEIGNLSFETHKTEEYYRCNEKYFRDLYEKRWKDIDKSLPDDEYYNCRRDSYVEILNKDKGLIVVLKVDDKIVGFRLGFLNGKCYYDWKICFDIEYSKYEVSTIMTGELIKHLIEKGYNKINYGPGDYSYKRKWSIDNTSIENYVFLDNKKGFLAKLYIDYELKYKNKLKAVLSKLGL